VRRTGLVAVFYSRGGPPCGRPLDELDAVGREGEGRRYARVDRCSTLDVETQTHQAEVPADSHNTGTELSPQVGVDVCLMDKFEAGAFAVRRERDIEPRHHLTELPRDAKRLRLLAAFDLATGVPLDLLAAAGLKISADRQKPPRDSVGVGQSVPEISLVGGVSTASDVTAQMPSSPLSSSRPLHGTREVRSLGYVVCGSTATQPAGSSST
jgi:hypothetical protein